MKRNTFDGVNLDHNLWDNHGTFWCHFTVHRPDFTKERVRRSLGTRDRLEARQRRDALFAQQGVCIARPYRIQTTTAKTRNFMP
jgi:hypothetical protein